VIDFEDRAPGEGRQAMGPRVEPGTQEHALSPFQLADDRGLWRHGVVSLK